MRALQYVEPAKTEAEALEYARYLGRQQGCIASRVIGDGITKPWAAQSLFELDSIDPDEWLPDGCRVVVVMGIPLACAI